MVIWHVSIHQLVFHSKLMASIQRITRVPKNNKPLSTRRWKKQRELVFRIMGHDCYICGEWADAVDHVISRKRGGSDDLSNLSPICKRCNSRKGSREYAVFLGKQSTPPVFPEPSLPETVQIIPDSPFDKPDTIQFDAD